MENQKFSRQIRQILKKSRGEPTKLMELITCILDMDREGKAASYPGIVRKMWPDEWEKARGLNPSDASDGSTDCNNDGYTNLEDYLNWLVRRQ